MEDLGFTARSLHLHVVHDETLPNAGRSISDCDGNPLRTRVFYNHYESICLAPLRQEGPL